jgi:hypothetical protein
MQKTRGPNVAIKTLRGENCYVFKIISKSADQLIACQLNCFIVFVFVIVLVHTKIQNKEDVNYNNLCSTYQVFLLQCKPVGRGNGTTIRLFCFYTVNSFIKI